MDPSYNNSNSGDGSGGMNPNGAMQPMTPAGPVVSEQPITPVQSVAPVQPVMPGQLPSALEQPVVSEQPVMPVQSVSPMQPAQRINPITHRPMGPVVGGTAMNQMSGQMTSPMMNNTLPNQNMMQPMSSGAGDDIVLAGAEKKKPKLSTIVIVAFAVLFAVVVLVLAITRTIGGGGGGNIKNTKEAFNRYANYYLYGEDKTDDIEMEYDGENDSYFDLYFYDEEKQQENASYLSNLRGYFDDYYKLRYNELESGDDEDYELLYLEEYGKEFSIVFNYHSGAFLNESSIIDAYISGGEENVNELIGKTYAPYENLGSVNGVDFYSVVTELSRSEYELISQYNDDGCISDNRVINQCVISNNIDATNTSLIERIFSLNQKRQNALMLYKEDVLTGIFRQKELIYNQTKDII